MRLDLLAEPAAHLGAGVAGQQADDVVLGVEGRSAGASPPPSLPPGVLHAGVEAERQRAAEGERRVLAPAGSRAPCGTISTVPLETASVACRPGTISPAANGLDLELVVGGLRHAAWQKCSAAAVERIERLGPARRQAPPELRRGLRDGRSGERADEPRAAAAPAAARNLRRSTMVMWDLTSSKRVRLSRTALKPNARLQLRRRSRRLAVAKPIGSDAVILHLRRRPPEPQIGRRGERAGWSPAL